MERPHYDETDALKRILRHHIQALRPAIMAELLDIVHDYNSLASEDEYEAEVDAFLDLILTRALVEDLGRLLVWVRADQKAKAALVSGTEPPPLLVLLSLLGIHGKEAIDTVSTKSLASEG